MPNGRMLIALHGEMGAGKDTVADYLVEHHGFTKFAFADKIREMALALDPIVETTRVGDTIWQIVRLSEVVEGVGWREAKDNYPEVRRTLQRLGVEVVRNHIGPGFWVNIVHDAVEHVERAVVTDVRFPNEGEWLKRQWHECDHAAIWWITRPGFSSSQGTHASEEWHPALSQEWVRHLANDGDLERLYGRAVDLLPTR